MRTTCLLLTLAMTLVVGCGHEKDHGSADGGSLDSGAQPSTDAGPTPTDGGPAMGDGGPAPTDAGPAPTDAGPAPTDAGPMPTDGGPAPTDAGRAPTDAGPVPADGGSGLVGSWSSTSTSGGIESTVVLVLDPDGTGSMTATLTGCTGSMSYGGLTWTTSGTMMVDLTPPDTCSGSIACSGFMLDCTTAPPPTGAATAMCTYSLSGGGDMLTVQCQPPDGGMAMTTTFTRV